MANKNVKITTDEFKLAGTFNVDNISDGIILLESPEGEVRLHENLLEFNGDEVEISIKRKIEKPIIG